MYRSTGLRRTHHGSHRVAHVGERVRVKRHDSWLGSAGGLLLAFLATKAWRLAVQCTACKYDATLNACAGASLAFRRCGPDCSEKCGLKLSTPGQLSQFKDALADFGTMWRGFGSHGFLFRSCHGCSRKACFNFGGHENIGRLVLCRDWRLDPVLLRHPPEWESLNCFLGLQIEL